MFFVYFITDGEYTKIGYTNNIYTRLADLQVGNPKELTLAYKLPFESEKEAQNAEKILHEILQPFAVRGEWFCFKKSSPNPFLVECLIDISERSNFRNISFKEMKDTYGEDCFETNRPTKEILAAEHELKRHGISLTTGKMVKYKGKSENGFCISTKNGGLKIEL